MNTRFVKKTKKTRDLEEKLKYGKVQNEEEDEVRERLETLKHEQKGQQKHMVKEELPPAPIFVDDEE